MRRFWLYILCLSMLASYSCIENDLPYPRIQANIVSISAVGEIQKASIDSTACVVTLYMPEDANIYDVKIADYTLTPGASIVEGNLGSPIDLSEPYKVVLSIYQDYTWIINVHQDIVRYFAVEGQVGTSVIDVEAHTVSANVSKSTDITKVHVTDCKLGSSMSVMTPDILDKTIDFTHPVEVTLDTYGHHETWTISVGITDSPVTTVRADAWTCVAWVYGEAEANRHNGVQYRIAGDTEWLDAPDAWITSDGGSFYARLMGLSPLTQYEARAISDNDKGEVLNFTTGSIVQMPNSDFDEWWLDGKVWCPWAEGGTPYWDTGNKGAATLGQSNSIPTDDTVTGTGRAAMLQTRFVGLGFIGKLAAGNIFVGKYVRTDGTNGVLSFGRPFTECPTKLKGYVKYTSTPISHTTAGFEDLKGRPDTCTVWVALIDKDEPFEIRTNPNDRQLFDPSADSVVAYGIFQSGESIEAYMPIEVSLTYKATDRRPKYILCAASASKYGDYFTGGNGSVLYVDDFSLDYDY